MAIAELTRAALADWPVLRRPSRPAQHLWSRCLAYLLLALVLVGAAVAHGGEKPAVFPQLGHSGFINDAVLSPDGKHLVVAEECWFKVWETESWRELRTVRGHRGEIQVLAMSPDSRVLASGSDKGEIFLWDWRRGVALQHIALPPMVMGEASFEHSIHGLDFSVNGRLLAIGGSFGLLIWDTARARTIWRQEMWETAMALRFAQSALVYAAGRKLLRETFDGRAPEALAEHPNPITRLAVSPDAAVVASLDRDDWLRITEVANGRTLFERQVADIAQTLDGRQLFYCDHDGSGGVFDFAARIAKPMAHGCPGGHVVALPGGGKLLGLRRSVAETLDVASGGHESASLALALPAASVAVLADGDVATVGDFGQVVRRWDVASGKVAGEIGGPGRYARLAASADGRTLAVLAAAPAVLNPDPQRFGAGIRVIDAESGAMRLIPEWPLQSVALSADGRRVLAHAGEAVKIWDAATGRLLRELPPDGYPNAVALAPDGARVLVAGVSGERLWRVTDDKLLWHRNLEDADQAQSAVFSPDGRRLFLARASGRIAEIDAATGERMRQLNGHAALVNELALSADGGSLASAGWDDVLRIWDLATGEVQEAITDLDGPVADLAFSRDGTRLFAAAADGSLRVWRRPGGGELARLIAFVDGEWLAITPEGFFNGSLRAPDNINVRLGATLYPLNGFYDAFYRPDLVERKLRGEDLSGLGDATLALALRDPPPTVAFTGAPELLAGGRARVQFWVRDAGGGIGAVRVFHNGKLVRLDRGSAARGARSQGRVDLEGVPGRNEAAVIALNRHDTVQGEPALVEFEAPSRPVVPRLYLLAIGIDDYVEQPLAFAVKDARTFAEVLSQAAASLYGAENIVVRALTDGQATRAGIAEALRAVAESARPWDTFVLFVASHGVLYEGRYAVVAQDYPGELPEGLVFADELLDLVRAIPAGRQALVLDTCYAGGLNSIARGLYDARMAVLARAAGMHVVASATETQEALDGYEGHGLFTYALLAALRDAATDRDGDRVVSMAELAERARHETLAAGARIGFRQTPVIMGFGSDTALYRAP